jgi:hypothetical protein
MRKAGTDKKYMNSIILYHGSAFDFDGIDLQKGRQYKDFGQGFYTSADINQAKSMAERNAQILNAKLQRFACRHKLTGKWLYHYRFDADKASGLAAKEFTEADRDWGRFITLNRSCKGGPHNYDVVIGLTANEYTNPTIQFYLSGGGWAKSEATLQLMSSCGFCCHSNCLLNTFLPPKQQ